MKPFLACLSLLLFLICLTRTQAQDQDLIPESSILTRKITACDSVFCFNSDGTEIFYRKCGGPKIQGAPKVLLIIHGIGYHSYPFIQIMNNTRHDSILIYAMDLRGHGLSGNTKGVLESNDKVLTDMHRMVEIIKEENPDSQIYLLGTSMGGIYALGYLLNDSINSECSGLILVGPALKLHRSQILQVSNLKLLYLSVFDHSKPGIKIDGKRLDMSSSNVEWINARKNDTLALPEVSYDYLKSLHQMQRLDKQKSKLSSISVPVLIQHGGKDKVADLKGVYHLKEKLTNAEAELIVYPECYHALFWENDSIQILSDMVHWVINH